MTSNQVGGYGHQLRGRYVAQHSPWILAAEHGGLNIQWRKLVPLASSRTRRGFMTTRRLGGREFGGQRKMELHFAQGKAGLGRSRARRTRGCCMPPGSSARLISRFFGERERERETHVNCSPRILWPRDFFWLTAKYRSKAANAFHISISRTSLGLFNWARL